MYLELTLTDWHGIQNYPKFSVPGRINWNLDKYRRTAEISYNMGKHNKEKRKAYLKRRRAKIRQLKISEKDEEECHIPHVNGITCHSASGPEENHHSACSVIKTTGSLASKFSSSSSSSYSSIFPTSSSSSQSLSDVTEVSPSAASDRGKKSAKTLRSTVSTSSTAAILRGEIPEKVENDILVRKWEEYQLLYKQLTLIKRRLNVIEYGKKGRILNQLGVDMKR